MQGTDENVDNGADGAGDASSQQVVASPTRYLRLSFISVILWVLDDCAKSVSLLFSFCWHLY